MSNIKYSKQLNLSVKHNAFTYQNEAFEAIKDLDYSGIFHEQGLGKTKIAIDLLIYWLQKREIDTVMVVTKKQLVNNWVGEFSNHTFLKPKILSSNKSENYFILNSKARIIITNFETISGDVDRLKLYLKTRNVAIVIDESTKIKNPYSKLTQNFFELRTLFKIRTIMTGTPVANRPYDIWAQIYFLDGGESLGEDFEEFKKKTDLSNKLNDDLLKQNEFENTVASIFKKINKFCVRETKNSGIITLPNKIYHSVMVNFEPIQESMYERIREECAILIQKDNDAILDESDVSLKRLLRLLQVTSNPRLIDELYGYESGKEKALNSLLNDIVNRNEKVIVWSNFLENIDYFTKKYSQLNPCKIHGKMTIEERNKSVKKFKDDESCKVLFATPQSAKEGLTLTVANNVIFYDRGFNLDDYLQAQDRIHRISQVKDCNIYVMMVDNSIDIWIDKLLEAKQNAAFLTQGDYQIATYKKVADYSYSELVKNILCIN